MLFVPSFQVIDTIEQKFYDSDIKNEPMLFGADWNYARNNGGLLTNLILDRLNLNNSFYNKLLLLELGYNIVIDTRVTMTMPGFYPSIPGWHCDDWKRKNGQPDLSSLDPNILHFMCLISERDVSRTEFLSESINVELDVDNVWYSLDNKVNEKFRKIFKIGNGDICLFSQTDIHRATPTIEAGWRLFFRLSITHREPKNEIRNQVQIYVPENAGW